MAEFEAILANLRVPHQSVNRRADRGGGGDETVVSVNRIMLDDAMAFQLGTALQQTTLAVSKLVLNPDYLTNARWKLRAVAGIPPDEFSYSSL